MLVDTSVWIDHFRRGNRALVDLLEAGEVECHEFVLGELACGSIKNRSEILELLGRLPRVDVVSHGEVMTLIESRSLWKYGIGWVDAQLLASAVVSNCAVWTLDRRLGASAAQAGVSANL